MYVHSQQNLLKDPTDVWKFTVNTEATAAGEKTTGIPLNLYNQNSVVVEVDWGDGTSSTLTSADYASNDTRASVHEYETAGVYQVTLKSTQWNALYLLKIDTTSSVNEITTLSNSMASLYWWRRTLISVDNAFPKIKGTNYYQGAGASQLYGTPINSFSSFFFGCRKLVTIPSNLFANLSYNNSFLNCFYYCTSLNSIPSKLFEKNINAITFDGCFRECNAIKIIPSDLFANTVRATSFYGCFYNTSIQSIPANLFYNNINITSFRYCFYSCKKLQFIPAGLFDSNTAVTTFEGCFQYCTSLQSIPAGLFDSNTKVTTFYSCFRECTSLQSIPAGLFNSNTRVTTFDSCFRECTSLQSIPAGLFDSNTAVTNFGSCFWNCTSLQSIPSGLFDSNTAATTFSSCFRNCTSLQSIPSGLFDNNTAATNFGYCFSYCTSLQSIPSGLFDSNTAATTFSSCFYYCTSLQSIPSGLFDSNTAATDFSYCFQNCSSLQSIPSGLFDNNTAVTSFTNCFYSCSSLQSIPSGLFDNNTAVTSFTSCFQNCSSLQSIPSGLFDNNTAVSYFENCFLSCSSLASIPSGLFNKNTAVTSFSACFKNCNSLISIPASLFDKNTLVTNFYGCFYNCSSLKDFKLIIGSSLVTNFTTFISNASNVTRIVCVPDNSTTYTTLSNYAVIGNDKNNITASTHNIDCTQTLEYTVDTDATTANAKVATIPLSAVNNASSKLLIDWGDGNGVELNPNQVTAANLTHIYSAAGNYQVTVGTINWLDYQFLADSSASSSNTLVQTFRETVVSIDEAIPPVSNTTLDYWFYNCTHLESYPRHIFDNLSNVTSAIGTFKNCSSLAVISAGTLRKQKALTNATEMFAGCTLPTYVPSGLLSQCRLLTNISSIFNGCTNLATIPNTLLLNNTAITTQTNAFTGCSNSNPTLLTKAQAEAAGYYVELFDTEATNDGDDNIGIPYNLAGQSITLTVDWGDASSNTLTASDYTASDSTASVHQYTNKGLYFVAMQSTDWTNTSPFAYTSGPTISSLASSTAPLYWRKQTLIEVSTASPNQFQSIKGSYGSNSNSARYFYCGCAKLKHIPENLLTNCSNVTDFYAFLSNCYSLTYIPENLFNNVTSATDFSCCFQKCSSLQSIPENLFKYNTAATTFYFCFNNCSSLQSIPENLFKYNTNVTSFNDCFGYCSSLQSIPENLFKYNVNATDFSYCFDECKFLSIPENLFKYNVNATDFEGCFRDCSSLASIPAKLFENNIRALDFQSCFKNCSSLASIPAGLFDNNTIVTKFGSSYQDDGCFSGCSSIQSIPEGLFDNNTAATNFAGCFYGCSSIQSIPAGLFDKNTAVTNFQYCFSSCSSIQSIPAGLFDKNTAVTNFQYCFNGCSSLASIPSGLFDKNTAATTFSNCFSNCSSFQSISSGLFDKNTAVTNFQYCFSGCTSLQSIPSGLFDNNALTTNFSYCFRNCSSLQSIPEGLFDKNTAVTNFQYCFNGCSSLASIPSGLFDKNVAVTSFGYCFYNCSSLTDFTLHIGSSLVTSCSSFVTKKSGTTRTIYVPANSTTYTTFSNQATTLGLTIATISYYDIVLSSSSDEKSYDGTALAGGSVTLSSGSLAEGDSFSYQMTGSQKWIGSSENTFTYSINNVSGSNYRVTQNYGTLTVTDDDIDDALIVTMTADGQEGSEDETQYRFEDEVTFEISVKNPYADAQTITLSEIHYVTLAQSTFANVAGGQTVSTTATYTVTEADILWGSFTNTITATVGNIEQTAECTILTEEPNGSLSINVTETSSPANNEAYVLGETIEYEINLVNNGNLTITDIEVTDDLTEDYWGIDGLTPGEQLSSPFTTYSVVDESDILKGSKINEVIAVGVSPDDNNPEVSCSETCESAVEEPNSSIAVSISYVNPPSNGTSYVVNEEVEYGLNVANNGNLTITYVEVVDETSEMGNTIISLAPGFSHQFDHSCYIIPDNITNGYFTIEGFVSADSPVEDEPEYYDTFAIQVPIVPE